MHFFAGVSLAWSAGYLMITTFAITAYFRFGRNREYLAFALVCTMLCGFTMARAAFYLADDIREIVLPGRVQLAVLPIASATLLYLGMTRYDPNPRVRLIVHSVAELAALGLAVLCLSGFAVDYGRLATKELDIFFLDRMIMHEYRMSTVGYVVCLFSLACATIAGALMAEQAKEGKAARWFFIFGIVLLNVLAVHDLLLEANVIKSVYMLEHGLFFVMMCVLGGFLEEFELSRRELSASNLALRNATRRAERADDETRRLRPMADLGTLSASLAHEIRNPLAVISNVSSTLQRHGLKSMSPEDFESLVVMLKEETERLARLVDDLLLFSRTGRTSKEPVDPTLLVQQAIADIETLSPLDGETRIISEIESGMEPCLGSMDDLRRALVNLITNAVQSSGGKGVIRVVARRDPGFPETLMIGVEDEAGGIPTESVTDIFKPFFSTRPAGTGLGLPIAKSVAEAHKGKLVLDNRPGIGSSFWLRLPVSSSLRSGGK